MTKRLICIILAASMLFALAACAAGPQSPDTEITTAVRDDSASETALPDETTIYYEPDHLPETLNFGGEKVVILAPIDSIFANEISTEELTNEPVNDSVFNRERFVEERLGVEIEQYGVKQIEYNKTFETQMASDDNLYQICAAATVWFSPFIFNNYLQDLYDIDYLDFSAPWWSQLFINEADIAGHLFLTTGSLALSTKKFIYALFFNKKLAEDYSASYPDLNDLYAIVESGDWTYDRFYSIVSQISSDLDGNSEMDENDFYGFGLDKTPVDTVWSSFDMKILGRDEDGWFTLDVNKDKLFLVYDMIEKLVYHTEGVFSNPDGMNNLETKFANGELLFALCQLMSAEKPTLRNMQDEYGIIPFPKYDDAQKEYYTYAHDQYLTFSIPTTNTDPDTSGAVLEAMASYSYRETVPLYLDVVLKGKYMSDAKSRRMVNAIVDALKIDAGWIYTRSIGYFASLFRDKLIHSPNSFNTEYVKGYAIATAGIKELKKKYSTLWDG
ncbi:MAG: hypothetical protein J5933_04240 [Clostridia bacterium]|nr:hypothetical protein [Clostridia bacterium]